MNQPLTNDIALRIGLAARELPDTTPAQVLAVIDDIVGLPPTPAKLKKISVKHLKSALDGEFADHPKDSLKIAAAFLRGDQSVDFDDETLPKPVAYDEGDMPESIRIGIASNAASSLDGHFGSCARFLIYQVSATQSRLVDVRNATSGGDTAEDKMSARADLIKDCQLLYVVSVGGPAAAKVVRRGVHPIKRPAGGEAEELISDLQSNLSGQPAPWLAKIMGQDTEERIRFQRDDLENDE